MPAKLPDDDASLHYEIRLGLRTQNELDPIEAWLKLNAKGHWRMEFQGMSKQPEGAGQQRLMVVFRFADGEDATRFQRERTHASPVPPGQKETSVVAKMSRSLTEVFTPTKKAAPSRTSPRPAAGASGVDHGEARDFAKHAAELVSSSGEVMASKVQLLGLDRLKAHFGDAWSRVVARADQIADRAIQKGLTPRDMVTKVHDLNYLVLFADASVEEAQIRCRMIASDISRQLIGDDGSHELLTVKTGVTPVDGDTQFEDTPSLDELVSRLVAHVDAADAGVAATPKAAVKTEDSSDPLAAVEFVYRPMWDVKRKVVTSFLCLPAVRLSGGTRIVGENAIVGIDTPEVQSALDIRILKRATSDLLASFNAGRKHLIAVPVHFETISTAQRRFDYLIECRRLPPMAAKLVLFEVVGAPDGVPQSRVLEMTTALRAVARAIMFRTSVWSTAWGDLAQARITAVGADLSDEHASETVLVERLVKFADAADKRKLGSYLHGLRTLSLTVSAVGAGFHHLSGQPIEDLADAPPEAHRFNLADLYDAIAAPVA